MVIVSKKEIRQDAVSGFIWRTILWMAKYKRPLGIAGIGLLFLSALGGGYLFWNAKIEREAATLLAQTDRLLRKATSVPVRLSDPRAMARLEEPIKKYKELMERFPKSRSAQEAAIRLGNLYYQLERYDEALTIFKEYVQRYPRGRFSLIAELNLGYLYEEKGDFEQAVQAYARAIEANPSNPLLPEVYIALARAYTGLGKDEEARQIYERTLKQYPNTSWADIARQQLLQTKMNSLK